MQCHWKLSLPDGSSCRWSVEGDDAVHDFFAAIVVGVGLEPATDTADELSECRIVGLTAPQWQALACPPADRMKKVLKVEWYGRGSSVNYLNLEKLPVDFQLMWLRRILVLHAFTGVWLAGRTVQVHGALFRRNATGLVIAGQSGTGKSTCAGKVRPPWECLCDDCMLLTRIGPDFLARPMPTWSAFLPEDTPVRPLATVASIPVQALVFLEQAGSDAFFPVTPGEAVLGAVPAVFDLFQVSSCAMPQDLRLEMKKQGFEFAAALAHAVPVRRMAHTLSGRPWELLKWGGREHADQSNDCFS